MDNKTADKDKALIIDDLPYDRASLLSRYFEAYKNHRVYFLMGNKKD